MFADTLAMARMVLPRGRYSLKQLAMYFGLPPKGDEVNLTKGLRVLPPDVYEKLKLYATRGTAGNGGDADLTHEVFKRLLPFVPLDEMLVIDLTVRLFTQPKLQLNRQKARDLLAKVIRDKRSALRRLGVTKDQLSSTDKFAALLDERFGIEVQMKPGKPRKDGSVKLIPALAKTDAFMKGLLDHPNPDVQAIAALRLKVKSTLEETRLRRMIEMHDRGPMCVYLNFAGAHTLRWSGGDKMNWQNFPRGSELRKTIEAPPGYAIVVVDKSQIEARILNCIAEQWDILELFEKGDPYSALASKFFKRQIDRKKNLEDKGPGLIGKIGELGLGYGMGPPKLRNTLRIGTMGAPPTLITLETAAEWVGDYRSSHSKVVGFWGQAETAIQLLDARVKGQPWGPGMIDDGYLLMPNGTRLDYTGLCREDGEWHMRDRAGQLMRNSFGEPIRLYGGLMTENYVQALSRCDIAMDMAAMRRDGVLDRWPMVMTTHDEIVFLAPENEAHECLRVVMSYMTRRKVWLPRLPLAVEGDFDICYSK